MTQNKERVHSKSKVHTNQYQLFYTVTPIPFEEESCAHSLKDIK